MFGDVCVQHALGVAAPFEHFARYATLSIEGRADGGGSHLTVMGGLATKQNIRTEAPNELV
ncbi:hypothetical protein D3C75_1296690 [compost metagenome]